MGGVSTTERERVPKQDRSRATRQRLLEAAVACLAEHGWAGSTVAVVAERAGVSRGAAQHHFPTREDLFTAAVEYVSEERSLALRALFPDGPADRRAVVAALVDLYTGPLFRAALHLWVAASDEEQLRARVTELEARVGRETHRIAVDLLGADESRPASAKPSRASLDMARGLGLANLLTDDTAPPRTRGRPVGGAAGRGTGLSGTRPSEGAAPGARYPWPMLPDARSPPPRGLRARHEHGLSARLRLTSPQALPLFSFLFRHPGAAPHPSAATRAPYTRGRTHDHAHSDVVRPASRSSTCRPPTAAPRPRSLTSAPSCTAPPTTWASSSSSDTA